jgi:acyl-CoA synthetase (AMP-forming)/AMP-acid ligase II
VDTASGPVVNIASYLPAMAAARPYSMAVARSAKSRGRWTNYAHLTFRQLDQASNAWARGLTAWGIGRGVRAALMVRPGLGFFALTFGLFKAGAVPILIDPGMGLRSLGRCLAEAEPEAFVGIAPARIARRLFGWGRHTIRRIIKIHGDQIWPNTTPFADTGEYMDDEFAPFLCPTRAEETAAILFTSGSTGQPKGAVYTHAIFENQVKILRDLYGIEPGEVDLCTFPLFALFAPALGMTAIVPDMDPTRPSRVWPPNIWEAVDDFGVTNMFGSPALLKTVARFRELKDDFALPPIRRVVSAGAPVPARVLESFAKLLGPDARIYTPYGATEALPVCSIDSVEILGETRDRTDEGAGVCVGRPVGGVTVRIIRIDDGPIPEWSDDLLVPDGTIGEIVVRGPIVTREYFNRPKATALAKIADPARGGFYHRMGDVGYRDDSGRIWFCGRKTHRVVTPEGTLFTIPCEAVFNTHPAVARTALVGVGKPGAMRPVLCVERDRTNRTIDRDQIRRELLDLGAKYTHTRSIRTILFHRSFPVDIRHNAKIFREKLAVWAAKRLR